MKVAFVGTRGIPVRYGGFETAVEQISTRFVERGHQAVVYCRKEAGEKPARAYKGVALRYPPRIPLRAADTLSHTFFSLLHVLVSRPDVVLVFNPANGPLCLLLRLAGLPFAINVDGLEWKRAKWSRLGQRYLHLAARISARVAPRIVADSRGIQAYYRDHFGRDSEFVPYGADLERSARPELLEEFGLAPQDYFLVVARLEPENNTDLVIEAFRGVETEKKLAIVGGVSYRSAFVSRLRRAADPRVVFLGGIYDQAKLSEIMCNCFAYVHGHEVGGTNPILLKALGSGLCVLYLDNVFNREVAAEAGIPFGKEARSLRSQMQELVEDPARAAAYRGLGPARIERHYRWDQVADGYEKLCRQLLK